MPDVTRPVVSAFVRGSTALLPLRGASERASAQITHLFGDQSGISWTALALEVYTPHHKDLGPSGGC